MARIAVDCDGVLANFVKAYLETANKIWPGRVDPNYQSKEWDDLGGLTKAEMSQVWKRVKATDNFWLSLDAYSNNIGSLAKFILTTNGHDIWAVTSRARVAGMTIAKQTEYWLSSCGIPIDGCGRNYVGVIPVGDSTLKADVYHAAGIQFSVDDKAETVEQCDHDLNGGHAAFLLDRSWNQDAKVKRRIPDLETYFEYIKGTHAG